MQKKVYFFKMELWNIDVNVEKDYQEAGRILQKIVEENAIPNGDDDTLDMTEGELHTMVDIIKLTEEYGFFGAAQQKPTGTFLERNYETKESKVLLNGKKEEEEGIEIYSYFFASFVTGIVEAVMAQGAPKEKVIEDIFAKYSNRYAVNMIPIPNPDGAQKIYGKENLSISKLSFEVTRPDSSILSGVLGENGRQLLEDVTNNNIKVQICLVADSRREKLIEDSSDANFMIRNIESRKRAGAYKKAILRGKYEGEKTRDYSFFDENFSYPIDVPSYTIEGGYKRYYNANELKELYYSNMYATYCEVKSKVVPLAGRVRREDE